MSPAARETEHRAISLFAAGSLEAALGAVVADFTSKTGFPVRTRFGPSGLLRQRIEEGAEADLFASADMAHPEALRRAGLAGEVALFSRNRLCALVRPGIEVSPETLLDALLDEDVRVATSTPVTDPAGDYAWTLFGKAERLRLGAFTLLEAKARKLTGGGDALPVPAGRNPYGWILEQGHADLFLTYRTNAALARNQVGGLKIVDLPESLAVGSENGLALLRNAPPEAAALRDFILAESGRRLLAQFGFDLP
ncbi:MAG: molybdate ABC transporter substrate-binding protein [Nisaea sp.]|uniref:molybdate ABC transporter substrate-binding protein n=1 Tax=Nisaea sp. TaxID=2024842 RepID=UPI001B2014D3|nr:molybdate ABC transporter substrate-binding protein [Nisaea sp.]MBO6561576.1 molybdate ABC transporter substrate-binding protein [Nisaea sp.]